eukprot:EG_transcript_12319
MTWFAAPHWHLAAALPVPPAAAALATPPPPERHLDDDMAVDDTLSSEDEGAVDPFGCLPNPCGSSFNAVVAALLAESPAKPPSLRQSPPAGDPFSHPGTPQPSAQPPTHPQHFPSPASLSPLTPVRCLRCQTPTNCHQCTLCEVVSCTACVRFVRGPDGLECFGCHAFAGGQAAEPQQSLSASSSLTPVPILGVAPPTPSPALCEHTPLRGHSTPSCVTPAAAPVRGSPSLGYFLSLPATWDLTTPLGPRRPAPLRARLNSEDEMEFTVSHAPAKRRRLRRPLTPTPER